MPLYPLSSFSQFLFILRFWFTVFWFCLGVCCFCPPQGSHRQGKSGKIRENCKKNSRSGKIRELEKLGKIREKSGNFILKCRGL